MTIMSEKEKIMARIQEALKNPAPFPGAAAPASLLPESNQLRAWLPLVGETFEERLTLFSKNSADLKAEFHLVESWDSLSKTLMNLRDAEGWKKVASHTGELTNRACLALGLPLCRTDQTYSVADLEACDVGITECDALIAQTGSVLVTNRSAGGRALSVLPPHHIVLARRDQLLPDLSEALALLKKKYGGDYPSFISFITGPSRTGDIERILVLGAHGPRKLTILFVCCAPPYIL